MKKVVKLTESDLMRIIKRVIKENEGENMIHIPYEYGGVRMELGGKFSAPEDIMNAYSTPEDIIDAYNTTVEEGIPLVSYSDGIFYNEEDMEIPVDAVLDELNYAIVGEYGLLGFDGSEDDDMPSYKTKWRMPSDDDDFM